jgi:hypothetical protein
MGYPYRYFSHHLLAEAHALRYPVDVAELCQ